MKVKKRLKMVENKQNPLEHVRISPDIANLKMTFKIGKGIKSIILEGNEEIDLYYASDLKSIDASKSTRYDADEIALYKKMKMV